MSSLLKMFGDLGIPLSQPKTVGPTTCLVYLGITLDSIKMEARLPMEKIDRLTTIIHSLLQQSEVTKRDLLVVLGHMNFAMQVVKPGRTFIGYLLQLAHSVPDLKNRVQLNQECRFDFTMWICFLEQWNGVSLFTADRIDAPDFLLYTDAAGAIGYGAYYQRKWFASKWPGRLFTLVADDMSIALMELYPIVMAAEVWGKEWAEKSREACPRETQPYQ
ncbi:uncharacterized protein LOC125381594 [Haliotis rufescens]|uniref:uncharacterized protein LOC125381594 n=1 Tax=Haliotis rufescens TaxID=6454 RepID=UPI00201EC5CA|nr:uncharacterized protein LOC125381594 [Haliotis rufescens]